MGQGSMSLTQDQLYWAILGSLISTPMERTNSQSSSTIVKWAGHNPCMLKGLSRHLAEWGIDLANVLGQVLSFRPTCWIMVQKLSLITKGARLGPASTTPNPVLNTPSL